MFIRINIVPYLVIVFTEVERSEAMVHNSTRQCLLKLIIYALEQSAPNLAHFLLGFEVRKPVSKTNLQDPGSNIENKHTF